MTTFEKIVIHIEVRVVSITKSGTVLTEHIFSRSIVQKSDTQAINDHFYNVPVLLFLSIKEWIIKNIRP